MRKLLDEVAVGHSHGTGARQRPRSRRVSGSLACEELILTIKITKPLYICHPTPKHKM